jgi:hypothetical protein
MKRILLLTPFVFLLFISCSSKHPSDKELLDNFQAHKAEFDQLLQMFLSDKGLGRVAYDFTRPGDPQTVGVTTDRLKEYRRRFDKLELSAGIEGYDGKDIVWLHSSTQGLAVSGSGKGYAYLRKPPEMQVQDLDKYWSKDGRSFTAFRHIEGNWYLYFNFED